MLKDLARVVDEVILGASYKKDEVSALSRTKHNRMYLTTLSTFSLPGDEELADSGADPGDLRLSHDEARGGLHQDCPEAGQGLL